MHVHVSVQGNTAVDGIPASTALHGVRRCLLVSGNEIKDKELRKKLRSRKAEKEGAERYPALPPDPWNRDSEGRKK